MAANQDQAVVNRQSQKVELFLAVNRPVLSSRPLIRDELGHKDIGTTQRYTEIPLKRLEEDFPTYSNQGENGTLGHQIGTLSALESEVAPQ